MKIESIEPPNGAGAGAAKVSPVPMFVGLKVPFTNGPTSGRLVPAASSSVNVTFVVTIEPPTSDKIMAFCPPGPTNNISTSSGKVCDRPLSVTVMFVTLPPTPLTTIFDG